jgi:hypothetical protein
VRTVKLVFTGGITQLCEIGQPPSVFELRHNDVTAFPTCEGSTTPFKGSA